MTDTQEVIPDFDAVCETFGSVLHAAEACAVSVGHVMKEAVIEKRYA